jgi:hypothetical protein
MFRKLNAINIPEITNVHCLCLESVTSHVNADSVEATDAPSPASTRSDGRAQQSSVPNDVKREKQLSNDEDAAPLVISFKLSFLRDRAVSNGIGRFTFGRFLQHPVH